jgi:hypothetical protein
MGKSENGLPCGSATFPGMKSKLSYSALLFAFVLTGSDGLSQSQYSVSFISTSYTFYCGIVNDARFDIIDMSGKNREIKFKAYSEGASLDYADNGQIRILPTKANFTIQVYGEIQGQLYFAGKAIAGCKDPPDEDAAFKRTFPAPEKQLNHVRHFSTAGKKIINDPDIFLSINNSPVFELKEGEENRIALRISVEEDGQPTRVQWGDYEIQSGDADIKKEGKHIFNVIPKTGTMKCTVSVFLGKQKIGDHTFRIVPK